MFSNINYVNDNKKLIESLNMAMIVKYLLCYSKHYFYFE